MAAFLRSACITLACLPWAFGQTGQPQNKSLLDTMLVVAGASEPVELTPKQQFQNYLLSIGGPAPLIAEAVGAGLSQWSNSPKEWGQGWGAYGKRFGSDMAYNGIRQSILYGLSIPLHEDTRYYPSKAHGFFPRAGHAVVSGAAAISSMWGPGSWKGIGNISEIAGLTFASTAAFNVFREFAPDIFH